jgi:hypothetical protein
LGKIGNNCNVFDKADQPIKYVKAILPVSAAFSCAFRTDPCGINFCRYVGNGGFRLLILEEQRPEQLTSFVRQTCQ